MHRTDKRRIQKELRKGTERAIRLGISPKASPNELGAVAIVIRDRLVGQRAVRTGNAAEAADAAFKVNERSVQTYPSPVPIDCAKGCSFCCYLYASATAPEIFALSRYLRANFDADRLADIVERCAPLKGMSIDGRNRAKIPCPLLQDNACSAYDVRPIACRMCVSGSRARCEEGFNGSDVNIPRPRVHIYAGSNTRLALISAIESTGRKNHAYELGEALALAIENPDLESRWLAGEDVFASCQIDPSRDREMTARATSLAGVIS
jgi:Fe-S-cluster containining protein